MREEQPWDYITERKCTERLKPAEVKQIAGASQATATINPDFSERAINMNGEGSQVAKQRPREKVALNHGWEQVSPAEGSAMRGALSVREAKGELCMRPELRSGGKKGKRAGEKTGSGERATGEPSCGRPEPKFGSGREA